MDITEAINRLEIQQLLTTYATAVDQKNFDKFYEIFIPDAFIDYTAVGGIAGTLDEIVEYLNQICKKENIEFELPALNLIAKKSDGSMRDSLTILDRVVNYSNNKILIKETSILLNVIDDDKYLEIVQKTQNGNLVNAIEIFNELSDSGIDEKEFMIGLIEYYRNLILLKVSNYSFQNENEKHLIIANETSNSNIINIIKMCFAIIS